MTTRVIKGWFLVHKWTSLVSALFLLVLCVTGLPLIFHHEIDHLLGYSVEPPASPTRVEGDAGRASVDSIVEAAKARRPEDAVQFLVRDPDEPDAWFVRLGETAESATMTAFYTYDARTGQFLGEYPLGEGVMNFLLRLHVDMFAGLPGTLFLGAMGVLLVAALVSGVVLYAPFMRRLPFGTVRRAPILARWLDLHNLLGIATFVWLLVVGASGVVNTLAIPIFGHWQSTELAEMTATYGDRPRVADHGSVAAALTAARAAAPGTELSFLAFPGNEFASPHHFVAFMQGSTPWTSKLLTPVLLDAETGRALETRELPWTVSLLLLSQPLHFGDYGGLPLKVLWAILDLLAVVVLWSGVVLWWKRRRVPFEEWRRRMEEARAEARSDPAQAVAAREGAG